MKKIILAILSLLLVISCFALACKIPTITPNLVPPDPPTIKVIEVLSDDKTVELKQNQVEGYDYTKHFTITVDGVNTTVLAEYIDATQVKNTAGEYEVTCNYKEGEEIYNATLKVKVIALEYTLSLTEEQVAIKLSTLPSYDFKALFTATCEKEKVTITNEMVVSTIKNEQGEYTYTVTYQGQTKTLKVTVLPDHDIILVAAYKVFEVHINDIATLDLTTLFSLYVDGTAVRVTKDLITADFSNAKVDDEIQVNMSYTYEGETKQGTVKVKVLPQKVVTVTAKNIVTYPNGGNIDLTTLFEVMSGDEKISITPNQIEGSIDYNKVGVNTIKLHLGENTYEATVEVKRGVVIEYPHGESVVVSKGTNKSEYSFDKDFKVLINGIYFPDIHTYINAQTVDFSTIGEYTATIKIPYNSKPFGITSVNFTYTEGAIKYKVTNKNYSIQVVNELVMLPKGTTAYSVKDNLNVVIGGRAQSLVEDKEWVESIACYYEVKSTPLDFTKTEEQEVKIAVYVNGVDGEPIIATYKVKIDTGIVITAKDIAIFGNTTLFTKDLFTVKEGEKDIQVTYDMIEGKVDTFKKGVYEVTLTYKGASKVAHVVVFDTTLLGTYKTALTKIQQIAVEEDSGGEDYMQPDIGEYSLPQSPLLDMVITQTEITVNGVTASAVLGIDANTIKMTLGSYDYIAYFYDNGVVVLNPDNSLKLGFNDQKRPLMYFKEDKLKLEDCFTVNYSATHVLSNNYPSYSLDAIQVKGADNTTFWYGLYIELADKSSSDTVYKVTWGNVQFDSTFKREVSSVSSLTFDGIKYSFTVKSTNTAQFNRSTSLKLYSNLTFKGVADGQNGELRIDGSELYTFVIGTKTIFTSLGSSYDISNVMINGGANYEEQIIRLNSFGGDKGIFSYKFTVDTDARTFTLIKKDPYFGRYESKGMYLFLDGYGEGTINFDTKSYARTYLTYTVNGNILQITYRNTKPNFPYGKDASFFIDPLLNILTSRETDGVLAGKKFENVQITDGGIVKVTSFVVGADSEAIAKEKFFSQIQITTKDGVLDDESKKQCINTQYVKFTTAGFYQFTITLTCDDKKVTSYYSVEVLKAIYENQPLAVAYGSGTTNKGNTLSIDKYGRASINCLGTIFTGFAQITNDTIVIIAYSADGKLIATGEKTSEGTLKLKCTGSATFTDYFTFPTP